jgi:hypothetical protein
MTIRHDVAVVRLAPNGRVRRFRREPEPRPDLNGPLVVRRPEPEAWRRALALVQGDVRRLTVVACPVSVGGTAVLVHRTPQSSRLG